MIHKGEKMSLRKNGVYRFSDRGQSGQAALSRDRTDAKSRAASGYGAPH